MAGDEISDSPLLKKKKKLQRQNNHGINDENGLSNGIKLWNKVKKKVFYQKGSPVIHFYVEASPFRSKQH